MKLKQRCYQLCLNYTADLGLCFHICRILVFLWRKSVSWRTLGFWFSGLPAGWAIHVLVLDPNFIRGIHLILIVKNLRSVGIEKF